MKSLILGTAGHIDHGKTSLVKALTGIDPDRLEEEKRRGITIDLGFAHMDLPDAHGETLRLGFVDVPGHERFVRNMLAGVGGIDVVLLVIAADESIKPQTREHFDILRLLGVRRGITVLTKCDAVDAETLDVARLEVEEFLRGTFLETPASPIVAVSARTGQGIAELTREIVQVAARVASRNAAALPRLPVDRVFSMKGFGTVVTGTLLGGTIRPEDELELHPGAQRVRVRGVQVHGDTTTEAVAGQRTALNLAGVNKDQLARGAMLTLPGALSTTTRMDVLLTMLPGAPPLKKRTRVHFHAHTMEMLVEARLLDFELQATPAIEQQQPGPDHPVFARIKLPAPSLLVPGDRFILRQSSPVVTIGGGLVLDAAPPAKLPRSPDFLRAMASGDADRVLQMRVTRRGHAGISLSQLVSETGWTQNQIASHLTAALHHATLLRAGDLWVSASHVSALQSAMLRTTEGFQQKNPLVRGIAREELRGKVNAPEAVFEIALASLRQQQKIETDGELVRLPGRGVVMKDEEAESQRTIEDVFAAAGLKVPALNQVLASLKIDKARAQKIVTLLLRDKVLVRVSAELVFHCGALLALRQQLATHKTTSPNIDVAAFKDMTGVSRKFAIPLLEYLDRERVTRRVGDLREIL